MDNQFIARLTGLSATDAGTLAQEGGVNTSDDLMALTFDDISIIIPNASILVRRKLANVARFVSSGRTIEATTTMPDIMRQLLELERPVFGAGAVPVAAPVAVVPTANAPKASYARRANSSPQKKQPPQPRLQQPQQSWTSLIGEKKQAPSNAAEPTGVAALATAAAVQHAIVQANAAAALPNNPPAGDRLPIPTDLYEPDNVDFDNKANVKGYFRQLDWLSPALKLEINRHEPKPKDIDDQGFVDKDRLAAEAAIVFHHGRMFRNHIQLAQMARRFAVAWGFDVVTAGTTLLCSCAKSSTVYISKVPADKQRTARKEASLKNVDCPFAICTSTPSCYRNDRGPPVVANPVTIRHPKLLHTCQPGARQQMQSSYRDYDLTGPKRMNFDMTKILPDTVATTAPSAKASSGDSPDKAQRDHADGNDDDEDTLDSRTVLENGLDTDKIDKKMFGTNSNPTAVSFLAANDLYEPDNVDFQSTEKGYFRQLEWLSPAMKAEVDALNPVPETDVDAETGCTKKEALTAAAVKLFYPGRLFRNYLQANQMALRFGLAWGFHCTTAGKAICCSCAKPNTGTYVSKVPVEKQRTARKDASLKNMECPFVVRLLAPARLRNDNGPPVVAHPVRISRAILHHSCEPGREQLKRSLKAAGVKRPDLFPETVEPPKEKKKRQRKKALLTNEQVLGMAQAAIEAANNDQGLLTVLAGMLQSATKVMTTPPPLAQQQALKTSAQVYELEELFAKGRSSLSTQLAAATHYPSVAAAAAAAMPDAATTAASPNHQRQQENRHQYQYEQYPAQYDLIHGVSPMKRMRYG